MIRDTRGNWIEASVAVVGGGPAGLIAAISLGLAGVDTVLVAGPPNTGDNRTTALLSGSIAALDAIGVWESCAGLAAPLKIMRIVDDTGRLMRAPEVKFDAVEIGLNAFGHNIENRHLIAALDARARALPTLTIIESVATEIALDDAVSIHLADHTVIKARLVIGADGRRSLCRAAAQIEFDERIYPQSALTLSCAHTRPHRDTSTEFHTPFGPFTQVPLPGQRSSLVWVIDPASVELISALDDQALSDEIERRLHSILGKITVDPGRGLFPLSMATVRHFAMRRIALIGEAAHVIPPIGAQGLNLGLRDATTIAELAVEAVRGGGDPGSASLLDRYEQSRRADVGTRALAVDLLNRSLLTDLLPVQGVRGLGLYLMERIGPLRRAVMREGVTPRAAPF